MTLFLAIVGLVLLIVGADVLVRGASTLATAAGISPLVVGLTVVAFGTSAPELAVSVKAALIHQGDVAMGNAVGSNIMNVLLILGLSAVTAPLLVSRQLVTFDVPVMIIAAVAVFAFAWDGEISRMEGIILVLGVIAYTTVLILRSRREHRLATDAPVARATGAGKMALNLMLMIIGISMLVVGAAWLVRGAIALARMLQVDELVVSLTVIAVGTSLPEIATSLLATWRGERDIAVGNVVGSNIFNLLSIVGIASVVQPLAISNKLLRFDLPVMLGVCVICWPVFLIGRRILRVEGVIFLAAYLVYTAYLVIDASNQGALPQFRFWMMVAVLPLLVIGLLTAWLLEHRALARRIPETVSEPAPEPPAA